jgi:hypothetical protein
MKLPQGREVLQAFCPIEKRGTSRPVSTVTTHAAANSSDTVSSCAKQRVKRIYNLLERQFRNYFERQHARKALRAKTC